MARYDGGYSSLGSEAHCGRHSYTKFLKVSHYGQKKAKRSRMLRQSRSSPGIQGTMAIDPVQRFPY